MPPKTAKTVPFVQASAPNGDGKAGAVSATQSPARLTIAGVELDEGATIAEHPELPGYKLAWVRITPSVAAGWLTRNLKNRAKKEHNIAALGRDLGVRVNGHNDWIVDGNTIRFTTDLDGELFELLDGQNRLTTIAQGTTPAWSAVVTGLDPRARWVIDTGAPRRVSDMLVMEKVQHASVVAALARRWPLWQKGRRVTLTSDVPSNSEQLECYYQNADLLQEAARFAVSSWTEAGPLFRKVTKTAWGIAWLAFTEKDRVTADYFLTCIVRNRKIDVKTSLEVVLQPGDPMLAFRSRVQHAFEMKERMPEKDITFLLVTCWNAYRGSQSLQRAQLPKFGVTAQNFPDVY